MKYLNEYGADLSVPFPFLCCEGDERYPTHRTCWANTGLAAAVQFCRWYGAPCAVTVGEQYFPLRTIRMALAQMGNEKFQIST